MINRLDLRAKQATGNLDDRDRAQEVAQAPGRSPSSRTSRAHEWLDASRSANEDTRRSRVRGERPAQYGAVMISDEFVPVGFDPPTSLATDEFRLEPLGPQHNQADHAAWMSSIEHIRSTPGYPDGNWPPPAA